MKKFSIFALAMLMLAADAAYGETLREINLRKDSNSEGNFVMFCSRPVKEGSPNGDALVAVGKGNPGEAGSIANAFGQYLDEKRKPALGKVPAETVTALRSKEGTPETVTFIVQLDDATHAKVSAIVGNYSAQTEFPDRPMDVCLNIAGEVLAETDLKMPYRSGLGAANLQLYFQDIGTLNRNR